MICIDRITKKYPQVTAVNAVSLHIDRGGIYGILGPNGAGKTTLINILCGLLQADAGEITIAGLDIKKDIFRIKKMIGVVPQELAVYTDLTAWDNVKFFASLYGLRGAALKNAVDQALAFTGLEDSARHYAKTFSGGMKRRLNIACGIAHKPEIIFMDEPTVGIDPQSRMHILESVRKLNRDGCTVIYTTHYMEEAEHLCSRLAIIDHGKIIAEGTGEELQSLVTETCRYVISTGNIHIPDTSKLEKLQGVRDVRFEEGRIFIENDRGVNNIGQIVSRLSESGIGITNIEMDVPSLETVFLTLTGRTLRDQ